MRNCIDVREIMRRARELSRDQPARGGFSRGASEGRSYKRLAIRWRNYFSPRYCTGRKLSSSFNDRAVAPCRRKIVVITRRGFLSPGSARRIVKMPRITLFKSEIENSLRNAPSYVIHRTTLDSLREALSSLDGHMYYGEIVWTLINRRSYIAIFFILFFFP